DINVVMRLNAQYVAMMRASQGAHGHLLRARAVRHKREQNSAALNADEWTQHIVTSSMQQALAAGPLPATPAAGPSPPAPPAPEPAAIAEPPAPAPAPAPPPAPVPAPAAAPLPAQAAPVPARQSPRMAIPAEADDPPRDLSTEADYYAVVYPNRAREIRHYGGLPPDCTYGPPDDDLVHAIVTGTTPALRALDEMTAAAE
ncbi:MAG TPA: hypothetical protein VND19_21605, partial [Acetobacteraceae bacterium]|nr:hypothetical protein [Acetobacteraceae bacterium]